MIKSNLEMTSSAFLLFFFLSLCAVVPLYGHAASLSDLVPCTNTLRTNPDGSSYVEDQCSACEVFTASQKVLNFIYWKLAAPLATVMFLWAGFLMVASGMMGSPGWYDAGKKIIWRTLFGVFIVFFAWMAIDTVIKLAAGQISVSGPAQLPKAPTGRFQERPLAEASPAAFGPWNEVKCVSPVTPYFPPPPLPGTVAETGEGGTVRTIRNAGDQSARCDAGSLAKLGSTIDGYFTGAASEFGVDKADLQAIMFIESGGDVSIAPHQNTDGTFDYGFTQIQLGTLKRVFSALGPKRPTGTSDQELIAWLAKPENAIRAEAAILQSNRGKCGTGDSLIASYNGGDKACGLSVHCDGVRTGARKWQCPYDSFSRSSPTISCYQNPGITDCTPNTGYNITRGYVPAAKATAAKIRAGQCN